MKYRIFLIILVSLFVLISLGSESEPVENNDIEFIGERSFEVNPESVPVVDGTIAKTPEIKVVQPSKPTQKKVSTCLQDDAVGSIVNSVRINNGLDPLCRISSLNSSAIYKAKKMIRLNCWAHNCDRSYIQDVQFGGFSGTLVGENLAHGFGNVPQSVVNGWMASPTHKANILKREYKYYGVGYSSGEYLGESNEPVQVMHFGK